MICKPFMRALRATPAAALRLVSLPERAQRAVERWAASSAHAHHCCVVVAMYTGRPAHYTTREPPTHGRAPVLRTRAALAPPEVHALTAASRRQHSRLRSLRERERDTAPPVGIRLWRWKPGRSIPATPALPESKRGWYCGGRLRAGHLPCLLQQRRGCCCGERMRLQLWKPGIPALRIFARCSGVYKDIIAHFDAAYDH